MKPHIYFDGEKWCATINAGHVMGFDFHKLAAYLRSMNEKRAMQYFTGR